MATVGPNFPGTVANLSNAGTSESAEAWVNPTNVTSDNATEAAITAASYDSPDISQILVCSNFALAVPAGATINGITVEIDRRSIIASSGKDFRVQLAKGTAFANLVGSNKAVPATIWPSTTAVATYGGAADLWGTTWTQAEVAASSFAVMISCQANIANADVGIDFVRVTITYTAVDNRNGTVMLTGGGTVSVAGQKNGLRALLLSASGVALRAHSGQHQRTHIATGGGTVPLALAGAHAGALTLAGGGTRPSPGSKGGQSARTLTGGGTAPRASTTDRASARALTGGGVVPRAASTARQAARTVTGGGTTPRLATKGALRATLLSGGGVAARSATTDRQKATSVSGGGTVVIAYETSQGESSGGTWSATGGGTVAFAQRTNRQATRVTTGAGQLMAAAVTARRQSSTVSGGGIFVPQAASGRETALSLSGSGTVTFSGTATVPPQPFEVLADAIASAVGVKVAEGQLHAVDVINQPRFNLLRRRRRRRSEAQRMVDHLRNRVG